jgi:hypothetical protein
MERTVTHNSVNDTYLCAMPNMTFSLDEETHALVKSHPTVNWSEIAREAFRRKARELHMWDTLLADSTMTEKDAVRAGDDIKKSIVRRLGW